MQKVHHCHIGIPMQLIIISSNTREDMIFFFGVTEVLPRYGARLDARDVAGKNASNFVAGSYVRRWLYRLPKCIEAAKTCLYCGVPVKLQPYKKS